MAFSMLAVVTLGEPDLSTIEQASSEALKNGDNERVMTLTEQGLAFHPHDPWLLYDRGAALANLGRLEKAVTALQSAEASFPVDQPWGRALASYRRALVLTQLGRCKDAQLAIAHYATLMNELDHEVTEQAQRDVAECERQMVRGRERQQ
jgi:tetratricopeptide (TPR) repeat protein